MILPGISGAYILVMLGKYQAVLSAVNQRDFAILFFIVVGAAIGLVTFAQILSWFFKRFHDYTVAVLIGLLLGSLRKVWPWKADVSWLTDESGQFILEHGEPIGMGAVLLLERVASRSAKSVTAVSAETGSA